MGQSVGYVVAYFLFCVLLFEKKVSFNYIWLFAYNNNYWLAENGPVAYLIIYFASNYSVMILFTVHKLVGFGTHHYNI